jgi:hypothetical protein
VNTFCFFFQQQSFKPFPMRYTAMLLRIALMIVCATAGDAWSQTPAKGLLIYKAQSLTDDEFATVTEFTDIEVFPSVYNFTTMDGGRRSVVAGLVARRVEYDRVDAKAFATILEAGDLAPLEAALQNLEAVAKRYAGSRKYLAKFVAGLKAEQEQFRKGQGKLDGKWYATVKAAIDERNRPIQLAKQEQERKEAMEKRRDERVAMEIKRRSAEDEATVAAENAQAQEFRRQIDALLKRVLVDESWTLPISDLAKLKPISKELYKELEVAVDRWKALQKELTVADARKSGEQAVPGLQAAIAWARATELFATLEANRAAAVLREFLAQYSAATNPELTPIWDRMLELYKTCQQRETEAKVHLGKAQQLAASGKNSQAISEYQAAFELFPDSSVTKKIESLRKESLGL